MGKTYGQHSSENVLNKSRKKTETVMTTERQKYWANHKHVPKTYWTVSTSPKKNENTNTNIKQTQTMPNNLPNISQQVPKTFLPDKFRKSSENGLKHIGFLKFVVDMLADDFQSDNVGDMFNWHICWHLCMMRLTVTLGWYGGEEKEEEGIDFIRKYNKPNWRVGIHDNQPGSKNIKYHFRSVFVLFLCCCLLI